MGIIDSGRQDRHKELLLTQNGFGYNPTSDTKLKDTQKFIRKMSIKRFFIKKNSEGQISESMNMERSIQKFKPKSKFCPNEKGSQIEAFNKMILRDFEKLGKNLGKDIKRKNLTDLENNILIGLKDRKELTIKSADKGGGVFVMSTKYYTTETYRLLDDHLTYTKLFYNPNLKFNQEFKVLLNNAKALDRNRLVTHHFDCSNNCCCHLLKIRLDSNVCLYANTKKLELKVDSYFRRMKTLKFIGAEVFISNQEYAQRNIKTLAHNLYPLLFKASYLHEKEEIIHALVENWPLEDFNLGKLLGKTVDCPEDITHWTCHHSLSACLWGLKSYVLNCSTMYSKRLKVVDISAIKDVETQECKCKKPLGRWERTKLLSQICYDLLIEMQQVKLYPSIFEVDIDVLCNIYITERSYELVVQALLMRCHSPLKIRCYNFRADNLSSNRFFYVVKLAEPAFLHKLEVVHNIRLGLYDLQVLLHKFQFPQLVSLTLPARTFNVTQHTTEDDVILSDIGEKLSNMTHLSEITLSFSTLTGRLRKLLRCRHVWAGSRTKSSGGGWNGAPGGVP
ncbi:Hypothetical predicted protein [Pelobates cultripes]|uniref:Uncharacterized protein n=1 Tax=Pelobates cultripes TaxID=61616 RepID=A0AAD1RZP8_PELCU|nr:Hypothetical predicted protein [Pelobates cultripes]